MSVERTLADWAEASLAAMRSDTPAHLELLAAALAGVDLRLVVDGESVGVRGGRGDVSIVSGEAPGRVRVETTRAALRDLLLGRRSSLALLRSGALDARGAPSLLIRACGAGHVWLQAQLRSEQCGRLLRAFCHPAESGAAPRL